jgi:Fe-S-cluster-containing hydrogenase component 2
MPMKIQIEVCLKCGACMMACPQRAILEQDGEDGALIYTVDADQCDECAGQDDPVCRGECPVPECLQLSE